MNHKPAQKMKRETKCFNLSISFEKEGLGCEKNKNIEMMKKPGTAKKIILAKMISNILNSKESCAVRANAMLYVLNICVLSATTNTMNNALR